MCRCRRGGGDPEEEFVAAVETLEAEGHKACFKRLRAGGVGFRVITRAPFSLAHLNGFPSPYVPLDLVVEALRSAEEPVDWLVMPLLGQPEVSVDCLTAPDGRVRMAVGRTKNGRRRGFTLHPSFIEPARLLAEAFGLHYLTNIQFRMLGDDPVLLDVNTRPAGGLHQLSQCGINAPWAAVRLALGEEPGEMVPPLLGQGSAAPAVAGASGLAAAAAHRRARVHPARRARPGPGHGVRSDTGARTRPCVQGLHRDHGGHRPRLSLTRPRPPLTPSHLTFPTRSPVCHPRNALTAGLVHTNLVAHLSALPKHSRTPPCLKGDRVRINLRTDLRRSRHRVLALLGTAALALAGAVALPTTAQAANILVQPRLRVGRPLPLVVHREPRLGRLQPRARRLQGPGRGGEFE